MLPQLKLKRSSLPMWLQYGLMVLAGAGSFYGAMQMGQNHSQVDGGVELRKASTSVPASPPSAAQPVVSTTRMDAGILQNPFGALNLLVTVESLSQPLTVAVTEVKVTRPSKKNEVPPSPVVMQTPEAPAEPVAPPLPYRVLGSIQGSRIGNGTPVVFLSDRGNTLAVKAGDEIGNTYRIERITVDKVEFIYLPLKTLQSLPIER